MAVSNRPLVISGLKWSFISQVGRQVCVILTLIILARVLSPDVFGIIGMANVVVSFLAVFKDLGTGAALIQRRTLSENLSSSLFWLNCAIGIFAAVTLFFTASLISDFYQESRVGPILSALSIGFLISAVGVVPQALLERAMRFETLAKLETISVLGGSVVAILVALLGGQEWSFVAQSLVTVCIGTFLLWLRSGWRPLKTFDARIIWDVANYSTSLTGFNIVNYLARNADSLIIGRILGPMQLGYYDMAYRVLLFPLRNISSVVGRVMFPLYSSFQDDNATLARAYLKANASIAFVTFPLMLGMVACADIFVLSVFGSQWGEAIIPLMILAPVGMIQSLGTTVGSLYQSKGRTDLMFRFGLVYAACVVGAFFVGVRWGIIGVAIAYSLTSLLLSYVNFAIPFKLIELRVADLFSAIKSTLANSIGAAVGLLILRFALLEYVPVPFLFFSSLIVGATLYATLSWFTNRAQLLEFYAVIRSR